MKYVEYYHRCSPEYVGAISASVCQDIIGTVTSLRKRDTQLELNQDLTWLFAQRGWSLASLPQSMPQTPPSDLEIGDLNRGDLESRRDRNVRLASSILGHRWVVDFCKTFAGKRVCLEVQFGKKEALFMDFCKLQIAHHERHLGLGIVIVVEEPNRFFGGRRAAISGISSFGVATETLPILGLGCPVWIVGLVG